MSAPAMAAEQVYIWRDQSGAVRFSAVQEPPQNVRAGDSASAPECTAQPAAVVVTDADPRSAH